MDGIEPNIGFHETERNEEGFIKPTEVKMENFFSDGERESLKKKKADRPDSNLMNLD